MRILYKKHVKRIIIYLYIYILYTCHYIHVARDAATDTAVVGHYKGSCTYVLNGAELLN